MAKIKVSDVDEANWIRSVDMAPPEMVDTLEPDEANTLINIHAEGSDDVLQLFEVKLPAGAKQRVHAHDTDEIIYVVSGAMQLGNRTLGPGSSVYVAKDTLYGFAAGEAGLRILVFRSDGRVKYCSKDDYLRLRAEGVRHPTEV